jgi:hypothetical protein
MPSDKVMSGEILLPAFQHDRTTTAVLLQDDGTWTEVERVDDYDAYLMPSGVVMYRYKYAVGPYQGRGKRLPRIDGVLQFPLSSTAPPWLMEFAELVERFWILIREFGSTYTLQHYDVLTNGRE